jgi:hypothetical protein
MTALDLNAIRAAVSEQLELLTTGGEQGIGWIPADDVAWGTYGSVTGCNPEQETYTGTGYIIHTHPLPGGLGGHGATRIALYLAALPNSTVLDADVIYALPTAVVTVLTPPLGLPAGTPAPWQRMPIEEQITEVAAQLGLTLRVVPADPNPLYQIGDDEPTALSRVADYLLAGGHAHSLGRARPLPHPNRARNTRRQP